MISLFALMLLGSVDVEAHPRHSRHHHRSRKLAPASNPTTIGTVVTTCLITRTTGHTHSNPLYVWKWTFGHYNRHGHWVLGHWSVVIRFN